MPDDVTLPPAALDELKSFYAAHGAEFLVLPNQSKYPLDRFYDTPKHLRESAQQDHSRRIAQLLRPYLAP